MNTPYGNQGGFGQNVPGGQPGQPGQNPTSPGNYGQPQPQQGWSVPGSYNPGANQGGFNQPAGAPGMPGPYGAQPGYGAPQPPKSNKKIFIAIGGGILALILIAGAAFFFASGGFSSEERAKKEILAVLQTTEKAVKDGKVDYRKMNDRLCKKNHMSEEDIKLLEKLAEEYNGNDSIIPSGDKPTNGEEFQKLTTDDVTIDPDDPNKATVKDPYSGMPITMVKEDGKWVIC